MVFNFFPKTSISQFPIGCGFGKDVEELKGPTYTITGYDPHYQPQQN